MTDKGEPAPKRARVEHFTEHFTDPDIDNVRVKEIRGVLSPQLLLAELPATNTGKETVKKGRKDVQNIIQGADDRLIVIVGPCSVHDPAAALDYATRLKAEKARFEKDLCIVMRVYFEKPRTTVGWKGLINDPALDESYLLNTGLRVGRKLLQNINHMGVPCAVEFLDTTTPQFLADLVSWGAIGARTTECQLHRELASGLSMPVGFKNGTAGDVQVAVDGCNAATHEHCFFGNTKQGTTGIVYSLGNPDVHVVLRGGGKVGPNYGPDHVKQALALVAKSKRLPQGLIIDCSHGNSLKDHNRQPIVAKEVGAQLRAGQTGIRGVMVESNLIAGNQALPKPEGEPDFGHRRAAAVVGEGTGGDVGDAMRRKLRYGVSITDACIDWSATLGVLEQLAADVRGRREAVKS